MKRRVWIIGPVAIDTVIYIDTLPTPGSFTRPARIIERIGGSSGNVALALAAAGIETGFISYIGEDENGEKISKEFRESSISHLHLQEVSGSTNNALVMIEKSGERTIVALTHSYLSEINLRTIAFQSSDIVVFSLWRPFFLDHLRHVQALGCTTIVGLEALGDEAVTSADIAIGSEAELGKNRPQVHLERFPRIVVTRGAAGSDEYTVDLTLHQEAFPAQVVDATGAGDSFLAGFLAILASGRDELGSASRYGARWAADSLAIEGSIPAPPPL